MFKHQWEVTVRKKFSRNVEFNRRQSFDAVPRPVTSLTQSDLKPNMLLTDRKILRLLLECSSHLLCWYLGHETFKPDLWSQQMKTLRWRLTLDQLRFRCCCWKLISVFTVKQSPGHEAEALLIIKESCMFLAVCASSWTLRLSASFSFCLSHWRVTNLQKICELVLLGNSRLFLLF